MSRSSSCVVAATGALAFAVAVGGRVPSAHADLDVVIANGDTVRGSLLPGDEAETFRFACPVGAAVRVTVKSVGTPAPVAVRVAGPGDAELGTHAGRSARVDVPSSPGGEHRIVVTTPAGAPVRTYTLSLRWALPRRADASATLAPSATADLAFAAEAGARVTIRASAPRKSAAVASLVSIRAPDGSVTPVTTGTVHSFVAAATGSYVATFANSGDADGDAAARADVKPPKAQSRKLAATTKEIPADAEIVASAVLGPGGGRLDAPAGGPLDGASVTFPAGALKKSAIVVLGAISDVTPPAGVRFAPGSAAAFVGPHATTFRDAAPSLHLPAAAAPGSAQAWTTKVFVPDLRGGSVPLSAVAVSAGDGTVDVELRRLTAAQAWHVHAPWSPVPQVIAGSGAGGAIAIGGGAAFVGQLDAAGPGGAANAGQVVSFRRSGADWVQGAVLTAPDAVAGDRFGWRVAFRPGTGGADADSVLVSAPYRARGGDLYDGAVYEFTRYGFSWLHRTTIESPASVRADAFGHVLAIDGDRLAVGASYDTGGSAVYPGVFTFHRTETGWEFDGEVTLASPAPRVTSLAASSGLLVAGSPTARGSGSGRVFAVQFPWTTQVVQSLTGGSTAGGDAFGTEVATTGALIASSGFLTGAASGDVAVDRASGAGWLREAVLLPDAGAAASAATAFGFGVAAAGERVLSGTALQKGTWVHRFDPAGRNGPEWFPEFLLADPWTVPDGHAYYGGVVAIDGSTVMTLANLFVGTSTNAYGFRAAFFELPDE